MSLVPPRVLHVVVGPDEHGVVRHGVEVARAAGDRLVRLDRPGPVAADLLAGVDVVHLPFTDRLFAPRCEDAADAFLALADPLRRAGLAVSVTLHDLPAGDDDLQVRRRGAYARVVGGCAGVVVNSRRELALVAGLAESARSLRMVPLPVDPVPRPTKPPPARWARPSDVVVLGFLFPDRGHEQVLDALPPATGLLALGRPSAGHEDLPQRYVGRAAAGGRSFRVSGFVADADLAAELWAAGVPVAPNRRVAASGSIGTWVAHGRRPLVPDTAYSRELVERWPGALTLYDPDAGADDPAGLAAALARAVADPSSTVVDDPEVVGPRLAEVVTAYARHFRGCGPARAVPLGGHRVVVPGNRWDLVDAGPARTTPVSVIVPYHRDQAGLDLVLTALTLQDHPDLEVVVADDGSPEPPTLAAAGDLPVTLVRQERRGFRAAAARNLGARAASGDVLVFLDGDTVPEPAYVSNLVRLPARCPDALVVGRRRHADLGGWTPARVRSWLTGEPGAEPPPELPEPGWLRDGYAASGDLLTADARSYRYVISAVMGLSRELFAEVGGFDERFEAYGGEDWELAHRLRCAGAVLAHVPTAVAWHDGPDWAGRGAGPGAKNAELLALSRLLPDPALRGGGTWALPAVVVEVALDDPAEVLATARAAFAGGTDCGVWLVGEPAAAAATVALLDDARVHLGPVPAEVADRAAATVRVSLPVRLLDLAGLVATAEAAGPVSAPGVTVTPTRVARRAQRWAEALREVPADLTLRLFGGRDVLGPVVTGGPGRVVDLGHELTMVGRWAGVSP